jgi:hypothetical protein
LAAHTVRIASLEEEVAWLKRGKKRRANTNPNRRFMSLGISWNDSISWKQKEGKVVVVDSGLEDASVSPRNSGLRCSFSPDGDDNAPLLGSDMILHYRTNCQWDRSTTTTLIVVLHIGHQGTLESIRLVDHSTLLRCGLQAGMQTAESEPRILDGCYVAAVAAIGSNRLLAVKAPQAIDHSVLLCDGTALLGRALDSSSASGIHVAARFVQRKYQAHRSFSPKG